MQTDIPKEVMNNVSVMWHERNQFGTSFSIYLIFCVSEKRYKTMLLSRKGDKSKTKKMFISSRSGNGILR